MKITHAQIEIHTEALHYCSEEHTNTHSVPILHTTAVHTMLTVLFAKESAAFLGLTDWLALPLKRTLLQ